MAKDHRRARLGMSFTAEEGNLTAEGHQDGSTSHGDEHDDGLKMHCTYAEAPWCEAEAVSSPEDF